MSVNVIIGTGTYEDLEVVAEAPWEVIPREGESLLLAHASGSPALYKVKEVRYLAGKSDKLEHVQIIAVEQRQVTADSLKII